MHKFMLSAKILAVLENQKDPKPQEKHQKGRTVPKGATPGETEVNYLCALRTKDSLYGWLTQKVKLYRTKGGR